MHIPASLMMVVVLGLLGAVIGWRRGTRMIYRRSIREPDLAPSMTKDDYDRKLRRRRKLGRLGSTLLYAAIGAGAGALFIGVVIR